MHAFVYVRRTRACARIRTGGLVSTKSVKFNGRSLSFKRRRSGPARNAECTGARAGIAAYTVRTLDFDFVRRASKSGDNGNGSRPVSIISPLGPAVKVADCVATRYLDLSEARPTDRPAYRPSRQALTRKSACACARCHTVAAQGEHGFSSSSAHGTRFGTRAQVCMCACVPHCVAKETISNAPG